MKILISSGAFLVAALAVAFAQEPTWQDLIHAASRHHVTTQKQLDHLGHSEQQ